MVNQILTTVFLLLGVSELYSQWECPSQQASHLKPIGKSKYYWSTELTGGAGYLNENTIFNGLGFLGIDRSGEKSTFYIEGGYKYWYRYDLNTKNKFENNHLGLRELFYQYRGSKGKLTLGIQSSRLDDNYLLNERMFGANYKHTHGPWSLNVSSGTITKDFSRNGVFCAVGYLYDIIPGREIALIGNKPFQTNFTGGTLKFNPFGRMRKSSPDSPDEFSDNGFTDLNTAGDVKNQYFHFESIGLALYHEYGSWIEHSVFTGGIFSSITLPAEILFKPEILLQKSHINNAVIYVLGLEKELISSKSRTNFYFRYYGLTAIDNEAKAMNSFSNIFAGSVLRLDASELPFFQASVRYRIPSIKTHLKVQYIRQTKQNPMQELDIAVVKKFGKHIQATLTGGQIKSALLEKDAFLARIELRFGF